MLPSAAVKAVIDIGTNSVLMLLGTRRSDGSVSVIRDTATVARLGEGVADSGTLRPDAIARTVAVLRAYRKAADEVGASIEAVATEGLRMASDRDVFLSQAHEVLGVPVRMISGDEEARLSYASVAREQSEDASMRVIDIGGASTELAVGRGELVEQVVSHKIGSVRLTEAHVRHDPIAPEELQAIERAARAAFAAQPLEPADVLFGLAGTVTTAAALLLGLDAYDRARIDGSRWSLEDVTQLRDELVAEPLHVRLHRPCLSPGRADVVVAGLSILVVAMRHCGARTLVVRDRGLCYALL